uniref:NACHT, LRR and PYD domains-containing protein 12-like n=1 Tax=Peromyscus maniculatus bairdii TaxID=230844 RepID=A0A8C8TSJ2_PERMB
MRERELGCIPHLPLHPSLPPSFFCRFKGAEVTLGLKYLWVTLISNRKLKYLNLGNTLLKDDDIKLACEALKHWKCSLETLRLDGCDLTSASCQALASALLSNRTLTHLCLSNNSLRAEEVRQLCQFIRHPDCALQRLILNQCGLKGDAYGFLALMLINNKKLTHLSLTMNPMEDDGVKLLCEALREPTCHLQELELVGCQLTEDCCEDLACVITANKQLTSLDLGNNALGDVGVMALCKGLRHEDSSLKRLGLEACGLTSECCEALSLALSSNQLLTSLNLVKNDFSTSGMLKLCSAFLHSTSKLRVIG